MAVKSTGCPTRGPGIKSQHPDGVSKPSVTPVTDDPMAFSDMHVVHRHTQKENHPYTKKINKTVKNK